MAHFLKLCIYFLLTYFWSHWALFATQGLSLVVARGLIAAASLAAEGRLVFGLQQLWHRGLVAPGMRALPRPGIEPRFPTLQGGFLITGPPGMPWCEPFLKSWLNFLQYCPCCFSSGFLARRHAGPGSPGPGISPAAPVLEDDVSTSGPREVPIQFFCRKGAEDCEHYFRVFFFFLSP